MLSSTVRQYMRRMENPRENPSVDNTSSKIRLIQDDVRETLKEVSETPEETLMFMVYG